MKQTHFYAEPKKNKFKWTVDKKDMTNKVLETFNFDSEIDAWSFLNQVNFYINDQLIYSTN